MIESKIRRWGNSYGVLIPKKEIERENLRDNEPVIVIVKRKISPAKELFGSLKIEESTDKIMMEIDEKFKSRFE